ncbi:DUF3592 domain-containing protein [Streptomyces capoamus]|uniref:DUF3592 domain-containing protein n=1 Tax=Streptomyces capoamus TaxID=68183 RepID=A0A919C8C5_9ACTN|nr:DUF3592 domain-containing protein [Streptomyces capoamus]GGW20442.1 hypothetical protein GCM10010501_65980 [Streptomyces libani subsp. rufus]GHG53371.1 hypothetical protein GCM10018980_37340 [Streptomyces capoamus]
MFESLFYVVPAVMLAGFASAAFLLVRRARRISRTWAHGLTAQARCLRMFTTTSGGGGDTSVHTTVHHVYEFTTREGRTVRFEEEDGPATVLEGDVVTVRYLPELPQRATARPPARAGLFAGTGAGLVFLGVAGAFCVAFMVAAHTMFSESGGMIP